MTCYITTSESALQSALVLLRMTVVRCVDTQYGGVIKSVYRFVIWPFVCWCAESNCSVTSWF